LILPHGEHQIDVSQYIYEMIALSVPVKRIHPGIKDGTLNTEALDKLNELKVSEVKEEIEEEKRIMYVALTRPKKYLYLSAISGRMGNINVKPSPFLHQMDFKYIPRTSVHFLNNMEIENNEEV
jgi:superfamily I DNA/RNA helicase